MGVYLAAALGTYIVIVAFVYYKLAKKWRELDEP